MTKNERIDISPLQNGYLVEYSYRAITNPDADDKYDRSWDYIEEKSTFKTWDEVVDFIKTKQLEVPPVK